jgi:hypothetical protein
LALFAGISGASLPAAPVDIQGSEVARRRIGTVCHPSAFGGGPWGRPHCFARAGSGSRLPLAVRATTPPSGSSAIGVLSPSGKPHLAINDVLTER